MSALFSLQAKLIAAFVGVVLIALLLAGLVFVRLRQGELEQRELDHVIAASPAVYVEFNFLQRRGDPQEQLAHFAEVAAEQHDVRLLLVDRVDGTIVLDTDDALTGERLTLPEEFTVKRASRFQSYVSWEPDEGPAKGLVLVAPLPSGIREFAQVPPRGAERYQLLLAVPESTIRQAWRDLLPGLTVAAAIALPVAVVLGVLVAQYIARPLGRLTAAAQRMAEGHFDVEVAVQRRDEVGRLAQAFSTMARRVGEAQRQMRMLVANISHDLKTPLTSILGFAQALRDQGAEDEQEARHMGDVIYQEAVRLSQRLDDLLLLSEIESGRTVLERAPVDLGELLADVARRFEADLEAKGVALRLDLADGLVVEADRGKLERALENLFDNARKYAPAASEVRVRADRDGPVARVQIANAAPDLTPEELPRLFERFYRRDRVRGERGSGLGLPIARELVELHGGSLDATLQEGEVVFTVRLPLVP